jgi:hypothetical protein
MNYKEIEKALRPLAKYEQQQEREAFFDGDPASNDREGLMQQVEVAEFLSVSARTLQRMAARGNLTPVYVRGCRAVFYRRREVEGVIIEGPRRSRKFGPAPRVQPSALSEPARAGDGNEPKPPRHESQQAERELRIQREENKRRAEEEMRRYKQQLEMQRRDQERQQQELWEQEQRQRRKHDPESDWHGEDDAECNWNDEER